jgi:hypothetical protein
MSCPAGLVPLPLNSSLHQLRTKFTPPNLQPLRQLQPCLFSSDRLCLLVIHSASCIDSSPLPPLRLWHLSRVFLHNFLSEFKRPVSILAERRLLCVPDRRRLHEACYLRSAMRCDPVGNLLSTVIENAKITRNSFWFFPHAFSGIATSMNWNLSNTFENGSDCSYSLGSKDRDICLTMSQEIWDFASA